MAAFPGEFDDGGDEEFSHPLPPEDRLWRHPSELGNGELTLRLDPAMVRNRWLSSQPSRASAWTAGLVGALLATGLVVLGTHLATALTSQPVSGGAATTSSTPELRSTASSLAGPVIPSAVGLGTTLMRGIERVGQSVVTIDVASSGADVEILGVIVAKNGSVLTSATALEGATSIQVTLPGNEVVSAVTVAKDPASGLAVLHVNGPADLPVATLAPTRVGAASSATVISAAGGVRYATGTFTAVDVAPEVRSRDLVDAMTTDLDANVALPGGPVLDAEGNLVGLVVGQSGQAAVVVPSWLALPVIQQLMMGGAVQHGWIGITGITDSHRLPGVLVTAVSTPSASARAGVEKGDVITSLNGAPVTSMPLLAGRLYLTRPGQTVTVAIDRGGAHLVRRMRLEDQLAS